MAKVVVFLLALTLCQGYAVPDDWDDFWDYNEVDSDTNSSMDTSGLLVDLFPELNTTEQSKKVSEF